MSKRLAVPQFPLWHYLDERTAEFALGFLLDCLPPQFSAAIVCNPPAVLVTQVYAA